jgi:hypothetical protein
MQKESGKNGELVSPSFGPESEVVSEQDITASDIVSHSRGVVSINHRYYAHKCECFSEWNGSELKKLSGTIEKLRGYTSVKLKINQSLCSFHFGKPNEARFKRPDISEDIRFYEIKVDPGKKLRIHGFFISDVFFLVWLDRKHACFKQ